MSLSYALGDDADLRRRLLIKVGAPRTVMAVTAITASGNNHTVETPDSAMLRQITSDIYDVAQRNGVKASSVKGETGAL